MGTYDVVIPLTTEKRNSDFELRFSLRSICLFFPHRNVYIVGRQPEFTTGITYIPAKDGPLKNLNIANKVLAAAMHPDLSDNFLFKADDIFLTAPLPDPIPDYYHGSVREAEKNPRLGSVYKQVVANSADGLYYDIHTPVLMNKHQFIEMMQQPWGKDHLLKSTYLNRYPRTPVPWHDVKGDKVQHPVFSTYSRMTKQMMQIIRDLYPEPCKYEADDKAYRKAARSLEAFKR